MSLLNINVSEVRIFMAIIILLVSCVLFAFELQSKLEILEQRLTKIESISNRQNEIYFNLRSLFDRNDWKWISCEVKSG